MKTAELELAKEYPSADEDRFAEKTAAILKKRIGDMYPPGMTLRDAHVKQHGTVKAEFIVEPVLPEELRVGVFKEARTYPAWIRFSNGNPSPLPDVTKDIRGMAIKLMEVEGEKLLEGEKNAKTQDFMVVSYNCFFAKDTAEVYYFFEAFNSGTLSLLWFFFNPFNPHIRVLRRLMASWKRYPSPLEIRYWSMTPYLLGSKAVKYSVKPSSNLSTEIPKKPAYSYMREVLKEHLAREEARFDFMIQIQTDPRKMPIEDSTVEWDERLSPFQKIATIRIPRQTFDSPEQMEFGDNLSFNPWHSLPEHRPLGCINRARKVIYEEISKFRHERNGAPLMEPTGFYDFLSPQLKKEHRA